jgi:hypothetical protein
LYTKWRNCFRDHHNGGRPGRHRTGQFGSIAQEGDDPYAQRMNRLAADQQARRGGRLHTSWDSLEMLPTPRGTRVPW